MKSSPAEVKIAGQSAKAQSLAGNHHEPEENQDSAEDEEELS
jgi:hypothetical protein